MRRRIRRRIRRRVAWRVIGGRRALVVPVAVAVGWELTVDARVVIVRELRPDVIVVVDERGAREELPYVREDDDVNGIDERGSELPAGESSPHRVSEEEVDEEY